METIVIETYMSDGVDLVHSWSSVKEAFDSGRLDYLWDEYDENSGDEHPDDLKKCQSVEELIEKVSYPFYLFKSE
jgi:hypothetical protein